MDYLVVVGGVVTSVLWFLVSLFVQKRNLNSSLVSSIIFAAWYVVFYFVGGYLDNFFGNMVNVNRYTLGIGSIAFWFLFAFLFQKKSMNSAVKSTGIFAVYVVLAEVIYSVLKNMNIRF